MNSVVVVIDSSQALSFSVGIKDAEVGCKKFESLFKKVEVPVLAIADDRSSYSCFNFLYL